MPNQATNIYLSINWTDFETILRVKRVDNHGNILQEEERRSVQPGVPVEVDVDEPAGLCLSPNIAWEDSLSDGSLNQETKKEPLPPIFRAER